MPVREIIEFAQANFGEDAGLPNLPEGRPRLPPWLEGRIERAVPIDQRDVPRIEDSPPTTAAPGPSDLGRSVEELFAFYLPFHFYKKGWGIYVRAYGLDRLARFLVGSRPLHNSAVVFAFRLLLEHERLHFLAELAASRLEAISGFPTYRPYFEDRDAGLHEEALANAYARSSAGRSASGALIRAADSWMSAQPSGYCDFREWLGANLSRGKRQAADYMADRSVLARLGSDDARLEVVLKDPSTTPRQLPREFLFDERRRWNPPTYLVADRPVAWLRFVRGFPKAFGLQVEVHTNDHEPPHIHIHVLGSGVETRYEWPALRPLRGDRALSRSDKKRLDAYVNAFGNEIDRKVKRVFRRRP